MKKDEKEAGEEKGMKVILGYLVVACLIMFFSVVPSGRAVWNQWFFDVQKADDRTSYETIRKVEDTARAMRANYEADLQTYRQYKKSDSEEWRGWAEQAKMRANKTAASYNEYLLKNEFVWRGNIPADIKNKLNYVEE